MAPQNKDLSYKNRSQERKEHLLKSVQIVNDELAEQGIKIRLNPYTNNTRLRLRYSVNGEQRSITPPGVTLTHPGLQVAKDYAIEIDLAIRRGKYSEEWLQATVYGGKRSPVAKEKVKPLTVGDVMTDFSRRYVKYRSGDSESTDRQKQRTMNNYLKQLELNLKGIPTKTNFDAKLIKQVLDGHQEGTDKRFRARETLSITCTLFGIEYNFAGIGKRSKPKRRNIPSDPQIIECYQSFDNIYNNPKADKDYIECYRWLFGVIATYGLRPQEAFAIDWNKSFKPENKFWIYLNSKNTDGLKTGDRWCAPLPLEWVELFKLSKPNYPPCENPNVDYRSRKLGRYLDTHNIGYYIDGEHVRVRAYDLRHTFAIRCRQSGLDLLDSADLMGHDPATHHKQYHRWINLEQRISSVENALERNQKNLLE